MATTPKLFTPLTLGGKKNPLQLQHRIAMAPMTRMRSGEAGVPPQYTAEYYAQRATPGGLLITEATNILPTARGYFGTPGIFNQDQIDAWKPVTKAVHDKGGVIFLQLWHTGRLSHPLNQPDNALPVSSSSNMPIDENRTVATREGPLALVRPRALEIHEIQPICDAYRQAAVNAIAAGFDGVELHAANGYLLEQFLHDGINDRTDEYGGSVENRARFFFKALDAILTSVDANKVGVRLSPYNITCHQHDSDPATTYKYVFDKLNNYDLAYVSLVEPRAPHYPNELAPQEGVSAFFRKIYSGVLITASSYDRTNALATVGAGHADIVAIGRYFISNPDLVERFKLDAALSPWNEETWYTPGVVGLTDYPFLK